MTSFYVFLKQGSKSGYPWILSKNDNKKLCKMWFLIKIGSKLKNGSKFSAENDSF